MKWVLYPVVTAMAMEKMGSMPIGEGVRIAVAAHRKIFAKTRRCRRSANEP